MSPSMAITREPGARYARCISCHPEKGTLDLSRAREEHLRYREALKELGLEVVLLDHDDIHPDSCFVEDTTIVHKGKALICRLEPQSRRGEETAVERILRNRFRVRRVEAPGTIEGGDVVHLPKGLVSGLSQRTNESGVRQAMEWLEVNVDTIVDPDIVHLKSYVTYLGKNTAICTKRFMNHPALRGLQLLVVPDEEGYAANTLAIGDTVLMSSRRARAQKMVRDSGFDVISLDTSEFEKCEGALTCLSIIL
jgi:dimethylargininase